MKFSIEKIKAEDNIGLSREGKPIDPVQPIWSSGRKRYAKALTGSRYPVAYSLNKKSPTKLRVTVTVLGKIPSNKVTLRAYYNNKMLFTSKPIQLKQGEKKAQFDAFAIANPINFCRFSGHLNWELNCDSAIRGTSPIESCETYLELYWIYGSGNTLFTRGVPVEILRQAAFALYFVKNSKQDDIFSFCNINGNINPSTDPVIEAIVSSCFFRNPPAYDIYKKDNYFVNRTNFEEPMAFLLHQYLSAIQDPTAICNCYDMTSAVQVYLKAVGIKQVNFCSIYPIGYLKLTLLVGRGLCNSPVDQKEINLSLESELVVDEINCNRKKFSEHTFCCLPDIPPLQKKAKRSIDRVAPVYCKNACNNCRILDACIGPHEGEENIAEYLYNTVDKRIPQNCIYPVPKTIGMVSIYDGVTHIDWCPNIENAPENVSIESFKETIKPPEKEEPEDEYFVVCSWPLPTKSNVLVGKWQINEQIIPGYYESQKRWRLQKKGETIQIDIYVTRPTKTIKASEAARYRFFALGSGSTQEKTPFEKGPTELGEYSVMCQSRIFCNHLWKIHNVTFRVSYRNTTCNFDKLSLWLKDKAIQNRKKNLCKDDLPPLETIYIKKSGKTATVGFTSRKKNILIDFVYKKCDGIRLIEKTDRCLKFHGFKPSTNTITISMVNKKTLLTDSKDITIKVPELSRSKERAF